MLPYLNDLEKKETSLQGIMNMMKKCQFRGAVSEVSPLGDIRKIRASQTMF